MTNATQRRSHGVRACGGGWLAAALVSLLGLGGCVGEGDLAEGGENLTLVRGALTTAAMGFAWVNATEVSPLYSFNTAGGAVTATNPTVGSFVVTFAKLGGPGGNVQVVAYGDGPTRCKVQSWGPVGEDEVIRVRCHSGPTPANSRFVVQYGRPDGAPDGFGAFLWADQPLAASYVPSPSFSFNSSGGINRINRDGVGQYHVFFPGLTDAAGSIEATAYGSGSEYCKVQSYWFRVDSLERNRREAIVRCFDASGAPTDTRFSLNYKGPNEVSVEDVGGYAHVMEPTLATHLPGRSYVSGLTAAPATCPGTVSAGRVSAGRHWVRYTAMDGMHSAVHVTAAGATANHCKVHSWGASADAADVQILCFAPDGTAADSAYVTTYSSSLSRKAVRDLMVGALHFETTTGGDDVREGSQVNGQLQLASGGTMPTSSLNSGANWPNNSVHLSTLPVFPAQRLGDLFAFQLTWDGNARRWPDGYDNWNLDSLKISIDLPGGCKYQLGPTYAPGRMTGSRTNWTALLAIP